MKRILTLLPAALLLHSATAQCTTTVPADAVSITGESFNIFLEQNTNFWLCDSSMAQMFMGGNNHFWIEAGAGNNSINSNGNIIYYKGTYPFQITGNLNTVYVISESVLELQGFNNEVTECPDGVVFDYGSAPANGCIEFTGISETSGEGLSVHYDLANDRVVVNGLSGTMAGDLVLLDMAGRELERRSAPAAAEWSMARYPSGYYIVCALAGKERLTKGFVKP